MNRKGRRAAGQRGPAPTSRKLTFEADGVPAAEMVLDAIARALFDVRLGGCSFSIMETADSFTLRLELVDGADDSVFYDVRVDGPYTIDIDPVTGRETQAYVPFPGE